MAGTKTTPMTAVVIADPGGFTVGVTHADWQSWTKAVTPKATKAVQAHMKIIGMRGKPYVVSRIFSHAVPPGQPRRSISTITYAVA